MVAVLAGTALVSSSARLAAVIATSVATGAISDTEATIVVFPTPNPPAITIFTVVRRAPVTPDVTAACMTVCIAVAAMPAPIRPSRTR
ncbi:hypothetical protein GCM10027610_105650 [Dactylosporangium cerinum]